MPAFPRAELEEMVRRFVAANDEAGRTGDWYPLSQFYAEDAIYTWNNGAKWEFMARGRKQIHDWVFGTEMEGLEKWTYPYVRTLIDDQKGEVIGIWRQIAPGLVLRPGEGARGRAPRRAAGGACAAGARDCRRTALNGMAPAGGLIRFKG